MFWTSANLRILPPVLRIGHTLCLVSCAMYRCIRCTPDMGPRHSTHTTGPRMGIGSVSWCWHLNVSETYDHPPILMVYPSVSDEKVPLWGDKFMSLRGICRNPLAIDASWCFTLLNTMVVNGFLLLANVGPQASENRIRKYHKYMGHRCLRCQWKWEEVIRQPGGVSYFEALDRARGVAAATVPVLRNRIHRWSQGALRRYDDLIWVVLQVVSDKPQKPWESLASRLPYISNP